MQDGRRNIGHDRRQDIGVDSEHGVAGPDLIALDADVGVIEDMDASVPARTEVDPVEHELAARKPDRQAVAVLRRERHSAHVERLAHQHRDRAVDDDAVRMLDIPGELDGVRVRHHEVVVVPDDAAGDAEAVIVDRARVGPGFELDSHLDPAMIVTGMDQVHDALNRPPGVAFRQAIVAVIARGRDVERGVGGEQRAGCHHATFVISTRAYTSVPNEAGTPAPFVAFVVVQRCLSS